jgi:hypothetical protein
MANCAKCGAELAAGARFCGACGHRVHGSSLPPAGRVAGLAADPFAKTVFGGDDAPSPAAPVASPAGAAPGTTPPAASGIVRGAVVLVHWADGNRYPATVLHISGSLVLVAFPNGQQQWIDARYLSAGG